jgi:hypothetical protein
MDIAPCALAVDHSQHMNHSDVLLEFDAVVL